MSWLTEFSVRGGFRLLSLGASAVFVNLALAEIFPPPRIQSERLLSASAWSMKRLPDDGAIVAGYAWTNGFDFYAARLDPTGATVWARTYGGSAYDDAFTVEPTTDGGFLLAGRSHSDVGGDRSATNHGDSDFWIVRTDGDGDKLWDASFGGSKGDYPEAVLQEADGRFLIGGFSASPDDGNKTSLPNGLTDAWLVCVSSNGTKLWDRAFGGTADDGAAALVHTADGKYLFVGHSQGAATGNKTSDGFGSWDMWIGCVNTNGNKLWDRSFGGTGFDYAEDVKLTPDGGFVIAGYSGSAMTGNKTAPQLGAGDAWVVRIDRDGNKLWDRSYGSTNSDSFYSVALTLDGGFIFSGSQGSDFWIVRTDGAGEVLWDRTFIAPNLDRAHSVVSLANGGYLVSGIVDIDAFEETWLIKLGQDSPLLESPQFRNGEFQFSLRGTSNDYVIEFSTNLTNWTVLGTNRIPISGSGIMIVDSNAPSSVQRFYHARPLP